MVVTGEWEGLCSNAETSPTLCSSSNDSETWESSSLSSLKAGEFLCNSSTMNQWSPYTVIAQESTLQVRFAEQTAAEMADLIKHWKHYDGDLKSLPINSLNFEEDEGKLFVDIHVDDELMDVMIAAKSLRSGSSCKQSKLMTLEASTGSPCCARKKRRLSLTKAIDLPFYDDEHWEGQDDNLCMESRRQKLFVEQICETTSGMSTALLDSMKWSQCFDGNLEACRSPTKCTSGMTDRCQFLCRVSDAWLFYEIDCVCDQFMAAVGELLPCKCLPRWSHFARKPTGAKIFLTGVLLIFFYCNVLSPYGKVMEANNTSPPRTCVPPNAVPSHMAFGNGFEWFI